MNMVMHLMFDAVVVMLIITTINLFYKLRWWKNTQNDLELKPPIVVNRYDMTHHMSPDHRL